jgi:hypothetical protein
MRALERVRVIGGWVLHVPVAGLMIFAGLGKLFGFAPPDVVEKLKQFGLGDQVHLIGAGELAAAVLLLVPRTSSLGLLLVSSFWGGVICIHMAHGESYLFPSVLLVLTWVGASLRNPVTLASFAGTPARRPVAAERPEPAHA